jgi:hypothetical protein
MSRLIEWISGDAGTHRNRQLQNHGDQVMRITRATSRLVGRNKGETDSMAGLRPKGVVLMPEVDDPRRSEQRMMGAAPGETALGRGPTPSDDYSRHEYDHPAAGWGAAKSVGVVLRRAGEPLEGFRALFVMNQENGGFDCPGCAWPDDPSGLKLDLCENGVKHTTWEMAPAKADRYFFAKHTVGEPAGWSDYDLEAIGRLAEPLSYNPSTDQYEPISWEDAFAQAGDTLRSLDTPHQATFYTSGRLSNEATFLYQLWVRHHGPGPRRFRGLQPPSPPPPWLPSRPSGP